LLFGFCTLLAVYLLQPAAFAVHGKWIFHGYTNACTAFCFVHPIPRVATQGYYNGTPIFGVSFLPDAGF
jgi:hypothetical protein